jgi:hypothetical protein
MGSLKTLSQAASYAGVAAALVLFLRLTAIEAVRAARRSGREDRLALGLLLAAVAAAAILSSGYPARGAHNNEHDFLFLGRQFFPLRLGGLPALVEDKEFSPHAVLALIDLVTGRSLAGFLVAQKFILAGQAALAYCFLRLIGARASAAAIGGGVLALSFPALIDAHAFTRAGINAALALSAATALAALAASREDAEVSRRRDWTACAFYLVFTSRFEFFAVLAGGAALVWILAPGDLRRRLLPHGGGWLLPCAFLALGALWLAPLSESGYVVWDGLEPWRNMRHHLGARHLTMLTGLPPSWGAAAGAALIASAALPRAGEPAWARAFLAGWAVSFAVVYYTPGYYPLQVVRHHHYFLVPFALLAGRAASFLPPGASAWTAAVAAPAFLALALGVLSRHSADLRTNDREWGFLLEARRDWPPDCGAVFPWRHRPDWEDSREGVIGKYFPAPRPGAACVLLYRSPRTEVIDYSPPLYAPYDASVRSWYGEPWRETVFAHRFYTDWHGPWQPVKSERLARIPVRAGFHRLSPAGAARFAEGRLLSAPAPDGGVERPVDGNRTSDDYRVSVEGCFSRDSSALVDPFDWGLDPAPAQALLCYAGAENEPDAARRAELLFSRSDALEALGRAREAREDAARALALAGPAWRRRAAAERRAVR